jgi:hypothetical protein
VIRKQAFRDSTSVGRGTDHIGSWSYLRLFQEHLRIGDTAAWIDAGIIKIEALPGQRPVNIAAVFPRWARATHHINRGAVTKLDYETRLPGIFLRALATSRYLSHLVPTMTFGE